MIETEREGKRGMFARVDEESGRLKLEGTKNESENEEGNTRI